VKQGTAVVLMESVRDLIIQRKTMALKRMLDKEDMENVSDHESFLVAAESASPWGP
jgi:adenylate kinase